MRLLKISCKPKPKGHGESLGMDMLEVHLLGWHITQQRWLLVVLYSVIYLYIYGDNLTLSVAYWRLRAACVMLNWMPIPWRCSSLFTLFVLRMYCPFNAATPRRSLEINWMLWPLWNMHSMQGRCLLSVLHIPAFICTLYYCLFCFMYSSLLITHLSLPLHLYVYFCQTLAYASMFLPPL